MYGREELERDGRVAAALAAAVAEERTIGVAAALAAAAAAAESCEVPASPLHGLDTGFWGRAAMAHHAAVPLGLLRRA